MYVDNLFLEGHLTPFDGVRADECGSIWFKVGVVADESEDQVERLVHLAAKLNIPDAAASRDDWLLFAQRLGGCLALRWDLHTDPNASPTGAKIDEIVKEADANFSDWMLRHYGTLASLPYLPSAADGPSGASGNRSW